MDRIDHRDIVARGDPADRIGDRAHPVAEILAPVAGDADDPLAGEAVLELGQPAGKRRLGFDPAR